MKYLLFLVMLVVPYFVARSSLTGPNDHYFLATTPSDILYGPYTIRSHHFNKYLSSNPNGRLQSSSNKASWETFVLYPITENEFCIYTHHRGFVSLQPDGTFEMKEICSLWEAFRIDRIKTNSELFYTIKSIFYDKYLTFDDGNMGLTDIIGPMEKFDIQSIFNLAAFSRHKLILNRVRKKNIKFNGLLDEKIGFSLSGLGLMNSGGLWLAGGGEKCFVAHEVMTDQYIREDGACGDNFNDNIISTHNEIQPLPPATQLEIENGLDAETLDNKEKEKLSKTPEELADLPEEIEQLPPDYQGPVSNGGIFRGGQVTGDRRSNRTHDLRPAVKNLENWIKVNDDGILDAADKFAKEGKNAGDDISAEARRFPGNVSKYAKAVGCTFFGRKSCEEKNETISNGSPETPTPAPTPTYTSTLPPGPVYPVSTNSDVNQNINQLYTYADEAENYINQNFTGDQKEARLSAVDGGRLAGDLATDLKIDGLTNEAKDLVEYGKWLVWQSVDVTTDFLPGVGLSKDLYRLAYGHEPFDSSKTISTEEKAFIAAAIWLPKYVSKPLKYVMGAAGKGVSRVSKSLKNMSENYPALKSGYDSLVESTRKTYRKYRSYLGYRRKEPKVKSEKRVDIVAPSVKSSQGTKDTFIMAKEMGTSNPNRVSDFASWSEQVGGLENASNLVKASGNQINNSQSGQFLFDNVYKGSFQNKTKSLAYHHAKHGKGRTPSKYIEDAKTFFQANSSKAKPHTLMDGTPGLSIKTKYIGPDGKTVRQGGFFKTDGKVVTYWD